MRKTRLEKEYAYHISWLEKYYRHNQLEKMADSQTISELERLKCVAWLQAIQQIEETSKPELVRVVKDVYIYKNATLTRAGALHLYYNERKTRELVRSWFRALDETFIERLRHV